MHCFTNSLLFPWLHASGRPLPALQVLPAAEQASQSFLHPAIASCFFWPDRLLSREPAQPHSRLQALLTVEMRLAPSQSNLTS